MSRKRGTKWEDSLGPLVSFYLFLATVTIIFWAVSVQ
jgi:hypothetical protein